MEEFKFGVWYPFDTAPKNETIVLVIIKGFPYPISMQFIENKWMSCWDEYIFETSELFTHWMPSPLAPSE